MALFRVTVSAFILMMAWVAPLYGAAFQRVISLSPHLTEEIYQLKADERLIANTTYCIYPEAARQKEKIGNVVEISVEKILLLKPDLVLASGLVEPRVLQKLTRRGIKVEVFLQPTSFEGLCDEYLRLGTLLGREKQARAEIDREKRAVAELRASVKKLPVKRVFVQIGVNPLFTVSSNSFIHDMIVSAGGINTAAASGIGMYSREQVLKDNPDVIIVSDMGMDGQAAVKEWLRFGELSAVKGRRVFSMDSYRLCSPTPLSFAGVLSDFIRMVHPQ